MREFKQNSHYKYFPLWFHYCQCNLPLGQNFSQRSKGTIIYIQWVYHFLNISLCKAVQNFSKFSVANGSKAIFQFYLFYFSLFGCLKKQWLYDYSYSFQYFNVQQIYLQMNFVLNPNPLPIFNVQKKLQSLQYYQWRYKQRVNQQQQQLAKIKKYYDLIQKEQKQQSRQNLSKKRMHHGGSFYDYNMQWKKKVDDKTDQQKNLKLMEITKNEQKSMRFQIGESKKQLNSSYLGPIEGWQKHFENYLKVKSSGLMNDDQKLTFEPKINQRSRKMAEGMTGKVQDRLILYGEFLRMKNQEQMNKPNKDNICQNSNIQKYSSNTSNQSQLFYRLYKQGEQANKRRRQLVIQQQHSFQPKINKLPQEIQDKIMKRRKPLYYIKNQFSNCNSQKNLDQKTEQQMNKSSKGDFQSFLKRNQALLDMKKKMQLTLHQKQKQKQNLQKSQCTFTPVLNTNSKKIQRNIEQNNRAFEQKIMKQINENASKISQSQIPLQNMDISKLTIQDPKQTSRNDQQDSLSIYKMAAQQKKFNKKQLFESSNDNVISQKSSSRIDGISKITHRIPEQKSSNNHPSTQVTGNNQQDSIQKLKNSQWESQLDEIQHNIQIMMMRVNK